MRGRKCKKADFNHSSNKNTSQRRRGKIRQLVKDKIKIQKEKNRNDKCSTKRQSFKKVDRMRNELLCDEKQGNDESGKELILSETNSKTNAQCSNCKKVYRTLWGLNKHNNRCRKNNGSNNAPNEFEKEINNKTDSLVLAPSNQKSNSIIDDLIYDAETNNDVRSEDEVIERFKVHLEDGFNAGIDEVPASEDPGRSSELEKDYSEGNVVTEHVYLPVVIDDNSQITEKKVNDVPIKNENIQQCTHCNKVFKTYMGVRRHESVCKQKVSATADVIKPVKEKVNDINVPVSANDRTSCVDSLSDCEDLLTDEEDDVFENKCEGCGEEMNNAHKCKNGEFECKKCSKKFCLKSSLERHVRVIHNGGSHDCPLCAAKCPDKGTLARHMYTHTGLKPYSCPVCKQEFSRKYHLVRHNMQTGCDGREKPIFPCQVCGREFNRKDNLREHLRAHAGQTKRKKSTVCKCCGVEYDALDLLKAHSHDKRHACDFCPKKFSSSGPLKKHRRTHTGERPFECDICQKRFGAKETLNRHVRIHTGQKPHCCQYCGKKFIQSTQLKYHLYYHTGQSVLQAAEAHVCDLCGKKFNRRSRLNEHVKFIHLGAKRFECDQCNKTFIRREDLNRHRIIHTGVKAHQCPICSKAFAMKSTLKVHLLTHTKEPPSSCDECGRAFIRQDCLLRHMRNKHKEMLEEIKTEVAKKKLQQQLLQVAAEASLVEGMEEREELDENGLVEAVRELLTLLVDETTLRGLGWPDAGVEALLEAVIKRCGHEPAPSSTPRHDRLRHNIKLLFTVVIDDSAVKALLNNQTVDEVILHVLRLAKS